MRRPCDPAACPKGTLCVCAHARMCVCRKACVTVFLAALCQSPRTKTRTSSGSRTTQWVVHTPDRGQHHGPLCTPLPRGTHTGVRTLQGTVLGSSGLDLGEGVPLWRESGVTLMWFLCYRAENFCHSPPQRFTVRDFSVSSEHPHPSTWIPIDFMVLLTSHTCVNDSFCVWIYFIVQRPKRLKGKKQGILLSNYRFLNQMSVNGKGNWRVCQKTSFVFLGKNP